MLKNIFYKTRAIPIKCGPHSFLNTVFHLTWIVSLHYLVKFQMFITQVQPLSCYKEKLQRLTHLSCRLRIRQIWMKLITGTIAREGDLDELKQRLRTEW